MEDGHIVEQGAHAELLRRGWRVRPPAWRSVRWSDHLSAVFVRMLGWTGNTPIEMLVVGGVTPSTWLSSGALVAGVADASGRSRKETARAGPAMAASDGLDREAVAGRD